MQLASEFQNGHFSEKGFSPGFDESCHPASLLRPIVVCLKMAHSWGYTKEDGPATWTKVAPAAKGNRQSPIDINPGAARYDASLKSKPFHIKYVPGNSKTLTNNGHSVQVTIDGTGSLLEGGPLEHKYQAAQFHFHWGRSSDRGSEHRINGKMYAAEAHIVHYNTDLFADVGAAAQADKGLCVLGAFLKAGKPHAGFQKLLEDVSKVPFSGDTIDLPAGYDPSLLLPSDVSSYWTYPGSLTTPPCFESVTWVVFKEPVEVSEAQLEQLRKLNSVKKGEPVPKDELGGKIIENYRPPLPLGDRNVVASFQS